MEKSKEQKISNRAHLTDQDFVIMLSKMWRVRLFEEEIESLYQSGEIHGTMHLCIGQEGTAIGSSYILKSTDWMMSTHRNHGHSLGKGTDMGKMLAEILGRQTGTNKGKGGSMHITEVAVGNLGSNGIVGGNYPLATGAALTAQLTKTDQVVLAYNGDGSVNEGSFHEALNLASIWQLPIIYFIENNQYGMSSSIDEMINIKEIAQRGSSYGIPSLRIDGNDVIAVAEATFTAIERARQGGGPTLIEALTYRHRGHSKSDKKLYRTKAEEEQWQNNDPISRLETQLQEKGLINQEQLKVIKSNLKLEIKTLVQRVKKEPRPSEEELMRDVYAK